LEGTRGKKKKKTQQHTLERREIDRTSEKNLKRAALRDMYSKGGKKGKEHSKWRSGEEKKRALGGVSRRRERGMGKKVRGLEKKKKKKSSPWALEVLYVLKQWGAFSKKGGTVTGGEKKVECLLGENGCTLHPKKSRK